jgi:uncharacterized phage protein (TIGR02218 family)
MKLLCNKNLDYYYLFEIHDKASGETISLSKNEMKIIEYVKTDSGFDEMHVSGIFSEKAIYVGFDIRHLEIKIFIVTKGHDEQFADMRVKSSKIIGQGFIWVLESATLNLKNNLVNKFYSKSCRTSFCSKECSLLLEEYNHIFLAYRATNNYITLDKVIKPHFIGGDAIFYGISNFGAKILKVNEKIVTLDTPIPEIKFDSVKLMALCDKSFGSCCNIFNNAANFRGEPHIPENEKFMVS